MSTAAPAPDGAETKGPSINSAHDAAVRQEALRLAAELFQSIHGFMLKSDWPTGVKLDGPTSTEAVLSMAEKFRAFLTVAGVKRDHVIQDGSRVRAVLSPTSSVALTLPPTHEQAPAFSDPAADRERIRIEALDFAMQAFPQVGRDILPDAKLFEAFLRTGHRVALEKALEYLQRSELFKAAEYTAVQLVEKAVEFDRYFKIGG